MNPFNCRHASTHVAQSDIHTLSRWNRWSLRFHLAYCWFCRKYQRQLGSISRAFREAVQQQPMKDSAERIKKRILDEFHD